MEPNKRFFDDDFKKPGGGFSGGQRQTIITNDEVDDRDSQIFEEDFPWQHTPENYAIAITGKAFNLLVQDKR